MLTFDSTGIDFAMTALFTTVYVQQWIDSKCHIPAVLGVAATLACRLVFGRDYFLIPAMVIIIVVLTVMRSRIEPQFREASGTHEAGGDEGKTSVGESDPAADVLTDEPAVLLPQRGGGGDE
jgi:uncharacterized membrane protein